MIEQPLEPSSIAFAVAIMAMGSALQASAGVGLALFVVPLLALVDRSFIPGPMLLAGLLITLLTAYRERIAIDVSALRSSPMWARSPFSPRSDCSAVPSFSALRSFCRALQSVSPSRRFSPVTSTASDFALSFSASRR